MSAPSQIPLFLINLDRSPERLNAFCDQMKKLGLTYERIKAVDGCDISDEEVHRLLQNQSQALAVWERGAMGCFLSHRKAWHTIVERELDWAFIAEDDVHIAKAHPFFSDKSWIPSDADIVKAETHRQRVIMSQRLSQKIDGHSLRKLKSCHLGTGGYFLNASAARFLLSTTESACDPVDHMLFDPCLGLFQQMTVYQIDPAICVQDFLLNNTQQQKHFVSTLQDERDAASRPAAPPPKPRGWRKVAREMHRPFKQFGKHIKNIRDKNVFKLVTYTGDAS